MPDIAWWILGLFCALCFATMVRAVNRVADELRNAINSARITQAMMEAKKKGKSNEKPNRN